MKRILELIIEPNTRKRKEFGQTLEDLTMNLKNYCSSLTIDESEDRSTVIVTAMWETEEEMNKTLESNEFKILSGAIQALCKKTSIRLNGQLIGNQLLKLGSLKPHNQKE